MANIAVWARAAGRSTGTSMPMWTKPAGAASARPAASCAAPTPKPSGLAPRSRRVTPQHPSAPTRASKPSGARLPGGCSAG